MKKEKSAKVNKKSITNKRQGWLKLVEMLQEETRQKDWEQQILQTYSQYRYC